MGIATTNPATGEVLQTFEEMSDAKVGSCLERAYSCAREARRTSFEQRATWMRNAARLLDEEQEMVARTITTEMGKTIRSARAEVAKCSRACEHYAQHAEEYLADEPTAPGSAGSSARYSSACCA